jgi:hypothetical protein
MVIIALIISESANGRCGPLFLQRRRMFIQGQFIRIPGGAYVQMRFSYNHYGL